MQKGIQFVTRFARILFEFCLTNFSVHPTVEDFEELLLVVRIEVLGVSEFQAARVI